MRIFSFLRALVYLRQIARELKRANDLTEARLALEHPQWYKSRGELGKPPKLVEIGMPTVEDWNKKYAELHPEEEG